MILDAIEQAATPHGMFVMGALQDGPDTVALVGAGSGMWPLFESSPEYADGLPDPLDRWSKRHITAIARVHDGQAVFPSDGPPYLPFIAWAQATGRFWQSPTGMLVHDVAGLMISVRGAIRIAGKLDIPVTSPQSPCEGCAAPCTDICPVAALSASHPYDVPGCKTHVASAEGTDCLQQGCRVRRICPISERFERDPEQSGFHMRSFMGA